MPCATFGDAAGLSLGMNRNDFRRLARIHIKEARALLDAQCYDGAYYLCGYAVECGLKACIAKRTQQHDFPDKDTVQDSYTHEFPKLLKAARLIESLTEEASRVPAFGLNWATVKDWSEKRRYQLNSEKEARDLYRAVTPRSGTSSPRKGRGGS